MAVTADKVVVEMQAKIDGWMRDIGRMQTDFAQKMAQVGADAAKAGKATAIGFDYATGKAHALGKGVQQAGKNLKEIGAEGRMAQQQMRNLAFQFQDIGTMLAAGQSPFMLLAQQLPQVTMYGGQLNGVMGALRGTVASLLSPLGLLTTGFVLAASGAISYFADASGSAKSTDEVLKEHSKRLDEIVAGYKRAKQAVEDYREQASQLSPEEQRIDAQRAQKPVLEQYEDEITQFRAVFSDLVKYIQNAPLDKEIREHASALLELAEAARSSDPDLSSIVETLKRFVDEGSADPVLEDLAKRLEEIAVSARRSKTAIEENEAAVAAISQLDQAFTQLDAAINKVTSEKAQKEVAALAQKAIDGEISIEDFKKAVAGLSTSAPDLSSHISEFVRLIGVIRQAKAEAEGFTGKESQGGRVRYGGSGFMQLPDKVEVTPTRRVDPYFDDPITKKRGGSKRENEYARLTKQIEARTKALQAETAAQAGLNPLIDDYGYAAEKAKLEAQLLVAAEQAKIEITPSVKQAIEATAEGYAQATVAARKLAEEQREALRSAEEWLGVGRDVTQGFISDLLNGASAADTLANALRKVGDALINDILNNIFKINSAGSGGILSSILSFFGGGFRANTTAGAFFGAGTGVPQFAGGTNYAPGGLALVGEKGPELVNLPRGSQVIPNHRLNAGGGQSVVVNFNPVIDARGADPAAIQRLETGLAKVRAEIPAQVVESVRKAQKSNVKLG